MNDIIGEPKVIPIFTQVQNPGDNATYTIIKFVSVRVMYARLTGNSKSVVIQPAPFYAPNVIRVDDTTEIYTVIDDMMLAPPMLLH